MKTAKAQKPPLGSFEATLKGFLYNTGIRVVGLAVKRVSPGWSDAWGVTRQGAGSVFWRVYWNDRPMRLCSSSDPVMLPEKTIGVIPPLEAFLPEIDVETHHAYLHFELPDLPAGLLREIFTKPLVLSDEPELAQLMSDVTESAETASIPAADVPFRAQAVASLAFAASALTLSRQSHTRLLEALRGQNPVSPALTRIHSLADSSNLDELAQLCGMSRRAFTASFRSWTGRSPLQYQLNLRLVRAASLLVETDETIEAVAVQTGFSDRYHLSKAFRRQHGQSPAAFRRRLQQRRMTCGGW